MTTLEIALAGYLVFGQVFQNEKNQGEIVRYAGLQAVHADGAVTLRLVETGRTETFADGSRTVSIAMRDEDYPFEAVRHVKCWDDCGVVETWLELRHEEPGPVKLLHADSFASRISGAGKSVRVLSLAGKWGDEANVREAEVAAGQSVQLLSRLGTRDAWESNAGMMVGFGDDVGEETGRVLGVALEWTGTTDRRVRRNWNGADTEVFAGIDMTTGPYTLDPGVTFRTPRAILVWSETGRGEVSRQYHRWARNHLMPHGRELRPILLNSWEGSRFGFREQTLLDMMDGVKAMGGEMFVLDDGWFGRGEYARDESNRDTAGLGDWCVNPDKLPSGMGWLAREASKRGLKFGLWVEPEMANTKSFLAEEHPDWLLCDGKRKRVFGRGGTQCVLDLTNPAVRDNVFSQIESVFSQAPSLAYIKWDCNANIVNPGSRCLPADRQANLWYDYTVGLYDLLARFRGSHPDAIIQACASGGGHVDFGFLRYADEVWVSDVTDPMKRVFIQWGTSMFYPACAMGCHVTASPNHQTGRETPLKYRFDVAMSGRMGFELHPKDLLPEELEFAKAAVAAYKRIRPVVQQGDLYRLVSPYEKSMSALMYAGGQASPIAAVVFVYGLDEPVEISESLHLRGLDPDAKYVVNEINCGARFHIATGPDASQSLETTGTELMGCGLAVRLSGPYDSAVFVVKRHFNDKSQKKGN